MLARHIVALWFYRGFGIVLLRNSIFFVIFQGVPDPLSPPLDPRLVSDYRFSLDILV